LQLILQVLCLAFDGFTLRYGCADDLVLYSIELFCQRLFICAIIDRQDNWNWCSI